MLDNRSHLEDWQVHGHNQATDEHAERVMDVLARRTPLALLDLAAATEAAPKVAALLARTLSTWLRSSGGGSCARVDSA